MNPVSPYVVFFLFSHPLSLSSPSFPHILYLFSIHVSLCKYYIHTSVPYITYPVPHPPTTYTSPLHLSFPISWSDSLPIPQCLPTKPVLEATAPDQPVLPVALPASGLQARQKRHGCLWRRTVVRTWIFLLRSSFPHASTFDSLLSSFSSIYLLLCTRLPYCGATRHIYMVILPCLRTVSLWRGRACEI